MKAAIRPPSDRAVHLCAGEKAVTLRRLAAWGFRIPPAWCCLFPAHETYQVDPEAAAPIST